MRVETGYIPRKYQREIHQGMQNARFGVLVCHRRFGKTVCGVNALIDSAARFKGGDGRFGYVAPLFKQAKRASWDYFRKYASQIPGTKFNESELTVTLRNGSKIFIDGADNPLGLKGSYYDGVVLDEVAQMKQEVWGEVVRPMLSDRNGWALFIGTPRGQNLFHDLYEGACAQGKGFKGWYAGMYRADETDLISETELELAKFAASDAQYRQEYLCDFTSSSDNILITIDLVSEACARSVVHEDSLFGLPKVMTVDVARYGDDSTVLGKRQGHHFLEPQEFKLLNNMHVAGVAAREWDEWKPDAVFIDGGRGEGVIDRLRQLGYSPIEVQFGGRNNLLDAVHYANKRTEMYDLGRKWLEAGGVLPNHPRLKTDLCSLTYDFGGPGGSMRLISKEQLRKDLHVSTDFGDSWAPAFAFPVRARDKVDPLHELMAQPRIDTVYDPYPVGEVA